MRRALVAVALAAAALLPAPAAQADTYCFYLRVTILGEHWVARDACVACPMPDGDCPRPEPPQSAPSQGSVGDPAIVSLFIAG